MNKNIILVFIILLAFIGVAFFLSKSETSGTSVGVLDDFARCLNESGAVFYGTAGCPHCFDQKKMFGDSFEYVNYVECTEEANLCVAERIEAVPTWIFGDGQRIVGKMSLEKISEVTGCVLPTE